MNDWYEKLVEAEYARHDDECADGADCPTRDRHVESVYIPQRLRDEVETWMGNGHHLRERLDEASRYALIWKKRAEDAEERYENLHEWSRITDARLAAVRALADEAPTVKIHVGGGNLVSSERMVSLDDLRAALDDPQPIDGYEQEPTCVCGEPGAPGVIHRADFPCFIPHHGRADVRPRGQEPTDD